MSHVLPPSFKPVLKQPADLLQDRSDMGCTTFLNIRVLNSAISQLVLQQCCKTRCMFFVACFTVPLRPSDLVRVKTDSYTKEALRKHDSVQLFIAIVFICCSILDNVIVVKCMKKIWPNCYISSYHLTWLDVPNTRHNRYLIQSTSWFNFDLFCRISRKQLCISSRIMPSDWLLCLLS